MKKIYTYLLLPVWWVCCLAACSDSSEPAVPAIELKGENTLNIQAAGGTLNLEFHSTFPWTASSDESWCALTTKSGEGGSITLPIEVGANEEFETRLANITLRSEGVYCKVQVVQAEHGAVTLVVKHTAPNFTIPVFWGSRSVVVCSGETAVRRIMLQVFHTILRSRRNTPRPSVSSEWRRLSSITSRVSRRLTSRHSDACVPLEIRKVGVRVHIHFFVAKLRCRRSLRRWWLLPSGR